MKKILILLMVACASIAFYSCSNSKANDKASNAIQEVEKTEVFAVKKSEVSAQVSLPAELTGYRQVDIFAKVTGYIKTLNVDIGSKVKAGQLIVVLEAPEINSRLSVAESHLKSQEAIYLASDATYNRILETSKVAGTISANDLEQALAKRNADLAQVEAARANHREISNMRNYLEIRAPFDGIITNRNVNVGAFVGGSNNQPLITIQQISTLRLSTSIPEQYTGYLKIGDSLTFKVNSIKGKEFYGKVSRMSGALDSRLRSERMEMDIENTHGNLLPGMIGQVNLVMQSRTQTLVVPKTAVMNTSEGVFVIKVVAGKAAWLPVETGLESEDSVEIFSGDLHENDALILKANEGIRDGRSVTI